MYDVKDETLKFAVQATFLNPTSGERYHPCAARYYSEKRSKIIRRFLCSLPRELLRGGQDECAVFT